jgi:hypothetical protein
MRCALDAMCDVSISERSARPAAGCRRGQRLGSSSFELLAGREERADDRGRARGGPLVAGVGVDVDCRAAYDVRREESGEAPRRSSRGESAAPRRELAPTSA